MWQQVTLQDVAADEPRAITDGPFGSNLARAHYTAHGPRVVRLQNIGDGEFIDAKAHISPAHFETLRSHEVKAGDLLVASLGEVLPRACLAPAWLGPAIVKADCIRVRLSHDVDPRWVMLSMQRPSVRKWAEEHRHGVGRPRLGLRVIRQIPIPLPPLREQQRIVEIVEDHLSHLDAADASLASSAWKAQALMASSLNAGRACFMNAGAPLVPIGRVADTALGKMLDSKRSEGEFTPYLANINVRWGTFELDNLKSTPLTEAERARFELKPGDILACEGGEPGRCAVWREQRTDIAYQKALHRIRPRDASLISSEFMAAMIEEGIRSSRWKAQFTGTTIKHLPQATLRRLEIPLPDRAAQDRWLTTHSDTVAQVARLSRAREAAQSRSAGLRRAVLAAAFSGWLTGASSDQDVIEEVAEV